MPELPCWFSDKESTYQHRVIKKSKRIPPKKTTSASLTMLKPLTVWITTNCRKSSRDGNTRPPYLPPEKSYAGQEATIRTGHGTTDWFQIGKGVCQGCILSSYLFHFFAEYIMPNARLDKVQAGTDIAGRNINKLRYADGTTLMEESKEALKSLLMKVKEESEKAGFNLNIQKIKIMISGTITSWQIEGETMETVTDYFGGLQNHWRW